MKLLIEKIGDFAELTGYIHEPSLEMENIKEYPAILILPGGAFRTCSDREAEPVALAYFAEGYQAFVLRYTTVTVKPDAKISDPMEDVQKAMAWIRSNEEKYYIANHRLALLGFSGGGHLASAVATHGPGRPDVLLLGYPGILHSDLRALDCPDIIECVNVKTPPTFMFATRDDKVTPPKHVLAFAQALDRYGIDFEMHIFRHGEHGLSLAKALTSSGDKNQINDSVAQWFQLSIQWLKEKFGEFTIYGVNDGRYGMYSIDSRVKDLLENAAAKTVLLKYIPEIDNILPTEFLNWITLRKLRGHLPGLTEENIGKLDRELLLL